MIIVDWKWSWPVLNCYTNYYTNYYLKRRKNYGNPSSGQAFVGTRFGVLFVLPSRLQQRSLGPNIDRYSVLLFRYRTVM